MTAARIGAGLAVSAALLAAPAWAQDLDGSTSDADASADTAPPPEAPPSEAPPSEAPPSDESRGGDGHDHAAGKGHEHPHAHPHGSGKGDHDGHGHGAGDGRGGRQSDQRAHGTGTGRGDKDGAGDGDGSGAGRRQGDAAPRHGSGRGRGQTRGTGAADGSGRRATAAALGKHGSGRGGGDRTGAGEGDGSGRKSRKPSHGLGEGRRDARGPGAGDGSGRAAANPSRSPFDVQILDSVTFVPSAQYRVRYYHHEGHDFLDGNVTNTLRHRARLGMAGIWAERLGVFMQVQDVRTFGEEHSTFTDVSADGFDMHQAFASFFPIPEFEIRLGRQEISQGTERLVGTREWREGGQSFDALRVRYGSKKIVVDGFYALVRETDLGLGIPAADGAAVEDAKDHLAGAELGFELIPQFKATVTATSARQGDNGKRLHTVGALFGGDFGTVFHYGVEGYYQFGAAYGDINFSSFLASAVARVTFDIKTHPYIEAYGTFVSGDDDPNNNTVTSFESPFGAKHKFYGDMDFFTNLPAHTEERGLRDIGGAIGLRPTKGMHIRVAHHLFQAMAERSDALEHFGHELDMQVAYQFWKYASVNAGYGAFFPGSIKEASVAGEAGVEHFAYATTDVKF